MKAIILVIQMAMIFIGSIVGAGVCSGRELNQFFATYGTVGFLGIIVCGILYIVFSYIIIDISIRHKVTSYNQFVELVAPKGIAHFINIVLTLFLLSSTSIILAGSGTILHQYFDIPKIVGISVMIAISSLFLIRNTKGLFEVNTLVVPLLVVTMVGLFVAYCLTYKETVSLNYLRIIPRQKENIWLSTLVYVSFNILTIIGVLVPLSHDIGHKKLLIMGIMLGSTVLTGIALMICYLMLIHPFYPMQYEMPLLAVAKRLNPIFRVSMLAIMWLEMFSSQVSNVYSLSYYIKDRWHIPYEEGIFIVIIIAFPFSLFGFSKLVEVLYPMFGVLSIVFLIYCVYFWYQQKKELP